MASDVKKSVADTSGILNTEQPLYSGSGRSIWSIIESNTEVIHGVFQQRSYRGWRNLPLFSHSMQVVNS